MGMFTAVFRFSLLLLHIFDRMHEEDFEDIRELVSRYETALEQGQNLFFDVDEFEMIIDHYLMHNEISQASRVLEAARVQHPAEVLLRLKEAQILVGKRRFEKALKILDELDEMNPGDPEIERNRANVYSILGEFEKAIAIYLQLLEHARDDRDELLSEIAFEYENIGNFELALKYFKLALEENPENESVIYELSFCFEIVDKLEESVGYFSAFIDRNPYSAIAWFSLGVAYNSAELYEKAVQAFDYALAIDDTFAAAYFNKANALANIGFYHQAIAAYKETFRCETPEAVTHYYIGECYERLEDFHHARLFFIKAIEIDKKMADAWMGAGAASEALNEYKEALRYMRKACELDKTNAEYWFLLGDTLVMNNELEEALTAYQRVTEIEPDNPEIWLEYSDLLSSRFGKMEEAIAILLKGIENLPAKPDLFYRLGAYYMLSGRQQQAFKTFGEALKMDFDGHAEIFEYKPELRLNADILHLIDTYRPSIQTRPGNKTK
jgi:tetratricopeptide (TPR) repeat protein